MPDFASIHAYRSEVDRLVRFGGSTTETAIRGAVVNLINAYARPRDLLLVTELPYRNPRGGRAVSPDGTLKNRLRVDHGFWESKDTADRLEEEIAKKFDKGYPDFNILFEDSQTAVLYQEGRRFGAAPFRDDAALDALLARYVGFEHPAVREFKAAVERFRRDIPSIAAALRGMIAAQGGANAPFRQRRETFHALCRASINPAVTLQDVDEMLIQHILTEEIFLSIFSDTQLLEENSIARELREVERTFFTGQTRRDTLGQIKHYYECIKAQATSIVSHREKQTFLKVIYENFYRAYNPKGADRLGIVYTPGEIVDFMVRSTDTLLHRHFGQGLADRGVEILDPATGTGTFVCEIIEYLPREALARKYREELHANEVAILPYYIANLNIETTYAAKMGSYASFDNLCFVDTLDNTEALNVNNQWELGGMSEENTRRIKRQNALDIHVIIGNPPYYANQENENDNNKSRPYRHIDQRIKSTYISASTAQKTKSYDMYLRFVRWASDRLAGKGIVAFICNRSFIDSRHADGFRKTVSQEFGSIYVVDLGGDYIKPVAGAANVFGISTGVAILFLVKTNYPEIGQHAKILYFATPEAATRDEKLRLLSTGSFGQMNMTWIEPDAEGNWLDLDTANHSGLLPLAAKEVKSGQSEQAVFQMYSLGVVTNRDEWVYDVDARNLREKIAHLIETYNADVKSLKGVSNPQPVNYSIKWTRSVKQHLERGTRFKFERKRMIEVLYRPFTKRFLYYSGQLNEVRYQQPQIFGDLGEKRNMAICVLAGEREPFSVSVTQQVIDLHFFVSDSTQCLPLYRFDKSGTRLHNITDWSLRQFQEHYADTALTKRDLFHYTYAVLHHSAYRAKYEVNLKRKFPRLPFYADFRQWTAWGKALMALHLGYEQAAPFAFERREAPAKPARLATADLIPSMKPRLKADKATGSIEVDAATSLHGVPPAAWTYRLGNRSALEWVLDQWKEHRVSDPTVAARFDTYRFAPHKEAVITLLARVCTVSVETMRIVGEMGEKDEG